MRTLYNKFFRVYKHEKISDKVIITRITVTVSAIVACLIAMSFTAYAYFSHDIISASNVIKSATFQTNVSVVITDENGAVITNGDDSPKVITSNYKKFKIEGLDPLKEYTVTITATDRSTATTGFIIVSSNDCDEQYHTQQLGIDELAVGGKTEEIKFKLKITASTDVLLEARWGTSSYYADYKENGDTNELYVTTDETVEMVINTPVSNSDNTIGDDTPSNTDTEETTPQE